VVRAFVLDSFDSPPHLRDDLAEPAPLAGGLLVRVRASSVNPADAAVARGMLKEMAEHDFPVTLGRDFAGVVEQVGSGVNRHQIGDEVYGFLPLTNPNVHDGSWTELIAVPEDNLVSAAPRRIDLQSAGAAPLAGLTALAAHDALALDRDETVLVIGAAGGVGSLFVQLAAGAGAHVIAPALPEDEGYLRDLGAAELLDRNADLDAALREGHADGVDAILDLVSYTPDNSLLKKGGRLASPLGAAGAEPRRFNLMAEATPENLARLAELLDSGALRVHIQESYELARADDALQALATSHTRGKLGLSIG
jgi:NADPH:quinone reductase-like Zn-dependent oxidoreductase